VRRPALFAAALLAASVATASVAFAQTTTTTTPATTIPVTTTLPSAALTRSTISVGGFVADGPQYAGADVGAQARFARANLRGVGGRKIVYVGTETDHGDVAALAATRARLFPRVAAVVPSASPNLLTSNASPGPPSFGPADNELWNATRLAFGFAGVQKPSLSGRVASPAWGITMRALLGTARGKTVVVAGGPLTMDQAQMARASLRAAGFTVPLAVVVEPGTDPAANAASLAQQGRDGVVLLADALVTASVASALAAQSYTGTVATSAEFYRPESPTIAAGLTVLVPYAPLEQATAANKLLLADVERFAPGTKVTAGVIAGYWAADEFVAALTKAGKGASAARLAQTLRSFTYSVPGTVGPTAFPLAHTQPSPCGALVQSDGTAYLPAVTYRCGTPVKVKIPTPTPTSATTTTTVKK
jgi:hypothetical protein